MTKSYILEEEVIENYSIPDICLVEWYDKCSNSLYAIKNEHTEFAQPRLYKSLRDALSGSGRQTEACSSECELKIATIRNLENNYVWLGEFCLKHMNLIDQKRYV